MSLGSLGEICYVCRHEPMLTRLPSFPCPNSDRRSERVQNHGMCINLSLPSTFLQQSAKSTDMNLQCSIERSHQQEVQAKFIRQTHAGAGAPTGSSKISVLVSQSWGLENASLDLRGALVKKVFCIECGLWERMIRS